MQIISGLYRSSAHLRRKEDLITDKVHIAIGCTKTLCGVDTTHSMILGFAGDGGIEQVNCKRCLKKYEKEKVGS